MVRADPDCLRDLARRLLDTSIPESLHDEIAGAVGLELTGRSRQLRDPRFRDRILIAYGFACAVCGYDLRLHHAPVALEAAHIKWHQAGGPSTENNGLALCSMHHKLFDRGAMTVGPERRIVVSRLVNGTIGLDDWLMRFHSQQLRLPRDPEQVPLEEYVRWHVRQVFKGDDAAA
jgi:putative restriction endonuclease